MAIHIPPLSTYSKYSEAAKYLNYGLTQYLARISVPFFFAAAGFFLVRKMEVRKFDISVPKQYISKLVRMLGVWVVILNDGHTFHLWYMSGLVVATIIFTFMMYKNISLRKMIVIAMLLYLIGLLGDSYYGLVRSTKLHLLFALGTTRNGIFMGYPFLLLGGIIGKKNISMKPFLAILGFAISMLALLIEAMVIKKLELPKGTNMYAFLMPATFFLLVFAVNARVQQRPIYKKMRIISIIVYFSHMFVYDWIQMGWNALAVLFGIQVNNSLVNYAMTVIFATILGIVIEKLSNRKKLSILKLLYS